MITSNSVLRYVNDGNETIRIIDIINEWVYVVELDAATSMPRKVSLDTIEEEIDGGELVSISDPFALIISEDNLSEIQIKKRDENWNFIEKYWFVNKYELLEKRYRKRKLEEIVNDSGFNIIKVKRLLTRYWQRGMNKNAVLPDYIKSGARNKERNLSDIKVGRPSRASHFGKSGINVTDEVKKHFEIAINKYYRNQKKLSLREVYTLMLCDFYSDPYKDGTEIRFAVWDNSRIPSYHQFYYWFKKREDIKKDIISRKGDKELNLKNRPLLSNSTIETDGPGTRFQVDATIADVYLSSALDREKIIGRPVVYAIIDVYSRLVTGIYAGLEGPSWLGAMMALDNMLTDKVEFCKSFGIKIIEDEWPAKHLPEIIIADRGEFEGYSPENLINNLNVRIENTSPYRGDLKGIVERRFRTVNGKLKHKAPGAIQKEYRERGDLDPRLKSTLTLKEFTEIYIRLVLHHNNKIIEKYPVAKELLADGILPIPTQLWNWGLENKKGRLKTVSTDILRLNLLPRGKASVSRAGIKFHGLSYSSDKAIREQWFIKPKANNISIVYDPRNIETIYIPYDNGLGYEECYLLETGMQYKGCALEEVIFNNELLEELKYDSLRKQNQLDINLEKEIDGIVKKAEKEKQKDSRNGESKSKQLKGIKNNRMIERENIRTQEAFKLGDNKIVKESSVIKLASAKKEQIQESSSQDKLMEKLKKKRDDQRDKK